MPKKTTSSQASTGAKKPSRKASTAKKAGVAVRKKSPLQKRNLWQRVKYGAKKSWHTIVIWTKMRASSVAERRASYLRRRPHRSFQLTRRRDYTRSLKLPGYLAFTIEVWAMLWRHKWTFILLGILFAVLTISFGLLGSQSTYQQIGDLLDVTQPEGLFEGVSGEVGKAGLVLLSSITQSLSATDESTAWQRATAAFFALCVWLTVVWLLRNIMAGKRVKLRDGLYSGGSPILSTFLVFIVMLIQLVPMALAIIVASAGWQTGFIKEGAVSMAAGLGLTLVIVASLYWTVSTFFALVIVTLPGMYPFRAIAIAGDLVVGRRLRLMYRIGWLLLSIVSWWLVVMIPIILLDSFASAKFEFIANIPIVPLAMLMMATFTIIWSATYIYLLYRKVVDDDASPA